MKVNYFKRYKNWLIIWIIFIILFGILFFFGSQVLSSFTIYTILTQNHWVDSLLIFLLIPIFSITAYFIGGYILTPLLIFLHKKFIGKNLIYGLIEREKPKNFKGAFLSSIFPALLAFNIAILLSDESIIHEFIFTPSFSLYISSEIKQILTIFILLPVGSALGVGVFSATFFLIDSGIEYTNKNRKKVKRGSFPIELRSLGGYYLYFLKGYAGISVVISIIQLISSYLASIGSLGIGSYIFLLNLLLWPIMPFIIALFMVPSVIIQDITYESRNKYVRNWAQKFGITGKIEDPLSRAREIV